MITQKDIKDLASLARMEIGDDEAESLTKEVDSILNYVGIIKEVTGDPAESVSKLRNVMREDLATNAPNEYTEKLLKNAPKREGNFLKVKKIL